MICNIVHSPIMLRMPSVPATPEDIAIGRDLADTLAAHSHECVGLAANMIGKRKCVIAATDGPRTLVMFNPRIIERHDEYQTEEACLSLEGTRPCRRYRNIRVTYLDDSWHEHTRSFSGFVAQIIQHECALRRHRHLARPSIPRSIHPSLKKPTHPWTARRLLCVCPKNMTK